MTPLTVCCVLVQGEYPYTPEYVRRLKAMVDRYLTRPFRFVCVTDQSEVMPAGVEAIPVERVAGCFAFWTKLRLFDVARTWTGRVLYIDLDSLIVGSLDRIVNFPASLALAEDAYAFERAHLNRDRHGRLLVRKFNSSVMVWDAGTHTELWDTFTRADAERLSTDQDFIAEQAPDAQPMPLAWFPRASRVQPPWPADSTVVLAKKPKGLEACAKWPWFEPLWGGWATA